MCGQVIGDGVGTSDAFLESLQVSSIDGAYLDGIAVTHGMPRQHIWSFGSHGNSDFPCPCDSTDRLMECHVSTSGALDPMETATFPVHVTVPIDSCLHCLLRLLVITISVIAYLMGHFGMDRTAPLPAAPSTLLLGSL